MTEESISELLRRTVETLRRKPFLYGLARDFAALRVRETEWKDEIEERELWDRSLGDDLLYHCAAD